MAAELRLRRGSTADHAAFTGAPAELTIDTEKQVPVVHDGQTPGGFPLAREFQLPDVATLLSLNTAAIADGQQFSVGGSVFRWEASSSEFRLVSALYVSSFGKVGTADDTTVIRAAHEYANANNIPLSYEGLAHANVQANAQIPVNTSVDYAGCVFHPLNGLVPEVDLSFGMGRYRMFVVSDPATPLVEETVTMSLAKLSKLSVNFAETILPTGGYFRMEGDPAVHLVPNRDATAGVVIDIPFHITEQGLASLPLPVDLSSGSTSRNIKRRANSVNRHISLRGIAVNTKDANNQTVFWIERNGVTVDGLHEYLDGQQNFTDSITDYIYVADASDLRFKNVTIPGPEAQSATYVLNINGASEVYVSNYTPQGRNWGTATGNYINGIYYSNCHTDRIDIHAAGYNFYVDRCKVNIACQYGYGGGTLRVSNTELVGRDTNPARALASNRVDYGGHFDGRIEVLNCTVPDSLSLIRLAALGCDSIPITCPDIAVKGVTYISDADGGFSGFDLLRATVDASKTGAVVCPREVVIESVSGLGSSSAAQLDVDFLSMEKPVTQRPWVVLKFSDLSGLYLFNASLNPSVKSVTATPVISIMASNCGRITTAILDDTPIAASIYSDCLVDSLNVAAESDVILANCFYSPHGGSVVIGRDTTNGFNIDVQGGVVKALSGGGETSFANVNSLMGLVNKRFNTIFPVGVTEDDAFFGWKR